MFISESIAGKRFVVKELMFVEEKEIVFTDFPIGATIQDGGKRKRSDGYMSIHYPRKINIKIK